MYDASSVRSSKLARGTSLIVNLLLDKPHQYHHEVESAYSFTRLHLPCYGKYIWYLFEVIIFLNLIIKSEILGVPKSQTGAFTSSAFGS